jgi:hypothetical protein
MRYSQINAAQWLKSRAAEIFCIEIIKWRMSSPEFTFFVFVFEFRDCFILFAKCSPLFFRDRTLGIVENKVFPKLIRPECWEVSLAGIMSLNYKY